MGHEWIGDWKQKGATLQRFIHMAEVHGMPVKFLRTVMREYTIKYDPGSGTAHTEPFWNNLILDDDTMSGLLDPENVRGSNGSVSTLYHEATHAYIDIVDLDDENLWAEAVWLYKRAKLKSGKKVSEPDGVVNEAAAMYVGHRASSMYRVWRQLAQLNSFLDAVETKKMTPARAANLIGISVPEGSIEAAYNRAMREVVFGYEAQGGDKQDPVASEPIPQQLRTYCDAVILEDKIQNDFRSMKMFQFDYARLQERMAVVVCGK